jgi:hypothetical protein
MASRAANQFLSEIGRNDRVAIWKYADKVEQICDFSQGYDTTIPPWATISARF